MAGYYHLRRRLCARNYKNVIIWGLFLAFVFVLFLNDVNNDDDDDGFIRAFLRRHLGGTDANNAAQRWARLSKNNKCPQPEQGDTKCRYYVHLQSGYGKKQLPLICVDSVNLNKEFTEELFDDLATNSTMTQNQVFFMKQQQTMFRGVHVAVMKRDSDGHTERRIFDTFKPNQEDFLLTFLAKNVTMGDVVFIASFGDVAISTTVAGLLATFYGSQIAELIASRDSFVIIGQKGGERGTAIEQLNRKRKWEQNAYVAVVTACLNLPLSPVLVPVPEPVVLRGIFSNVVNGGRPNCGLDYACPSPEMFPAFAWSGVERYKEPVLCLNSQLAFGPGTIEARSGFFNLVQYDPNKGLVLRHLIFSPLADDTNRLEIFLSKFSEDDLLIGLIFGNVPLAVLGTWPKHHDSKPFFAEFGLNTPGLLRPGSIAFVVGQLGSKLALEHLQHSNKGGRTFPEPLEFSGCLPKQVRGLKLEPEEPQVKYCQNLGVGDFFGDFCKKAAFQGLITRSGINGVQAGTKLKPENDPIFQIVVIAGSDIFQLANTLETLWSQIRDGNHTLLLEPDWIHVTVSDSLSNDNSTEIRQLVQDSFGFKLVEISSLDFDEFYEGSLRYGSDIAQGRQQFVIFIEPDVELSPDFFAYMFKLGNFLHKNHSGIEGISGWNPFGYQHLSWLIDEIYLTNHPLLPSPCFLVRGNFLGKFILPRFDDCCRWKRYHPSWNHLPHSGGSFIYPDVSRCLKKPPSLSTARNRQESELIRDVFHQPHRTSLRTSSNIVIINETRFSSLKNYANWQQGEMAKLPILETFELTRQTSLHSSYLILANSTSQLSVIGKYFQIHALITNPTAANFVSFRDIFRISTSSGVQHFIQFRSSNIHDNDF